MKIEKKPTKKAKATKKAKKPPEEKQEAIPVDLPKPKRGRKAKEQTTKDNVEKLILESCKSVGISCEYPVQFSSPDNCMHSGCFLFDLFNSGGYRNGRMHTLSGPSGAGKSTWIQYAILAAQKQKMRIYHFDVERSATFTYMNSQGIKTGDAYRLETGDLGYYYFRPRTLEETYQAACRLLEILPTPKDPNTKPSTLLIIDSYKSMVPKEHLEGKATLGLHARLHDHWQPLLRACVENSTATLIATNQMRVKGIGSFFCREEESAGNALKFYADARFLLTRRSPGANQEGWGKCPDNVSPVKLRVLKDRMCDSEGLTGDLRFVLGRGFDMLHDRLAFLTMTGAIKRAEKGAFDMDGKVYQYKKARLLMREKEWYKLCLKMRKDPKVYEAFFDQRKVVEDWGV
jgi:RecA/RadA recombinase